MTQGDLLAWTVARWAATLPRMTTFAASTAAMAGIRLAQERFGGKAALWGHGGAYDPRGEVALFERAHLFNRKPRARLGLSGVLDMVSRGTRLLATPAQIDGAANANLSVIGDWSAPKVALVGTRGLPDATEVHFVIPSHSARQLVPKVDFVSTCAANRGVAPWLFTELGSLRWSKDKGAWCLVEHHNGVDPHDVVTRTGFRVVVDPLLREIPPPPSDVLSVLDRVDPRRLRDLEFVTGAAERQRRINEIEQAERAASYL